jgi:hypothetical protein
VKKIDSDEGDGSHAAFETISSTIGELAKVVGKRGKKKIDSDEGDGGGDSGSSQSDANSGGDNRKRKKKKKKGKERKSEKDKRKEKTEKSKKKKKKAVKTILVCLPLWFGSPLEDVAEILVSELSPVQTTPVLPIVWNKVHDRRLQAVLRAQSQSCAVC